jgi:1-acyl-sn-glycerol-3-phosphate acyltransferase
VGEQPDGGAAKAAEPASEAARDQAAGAAEVARERATGAAEAARERAAGVAEVARERMHEVAEGARERIHVTASAARERLDADPRRQKRHDVKWARSLPARLVRGALQRGLLIPTVAFISPVNVVGRRNLRTLRGRPAVFVANHQSHFDAPVILSALGPRIRRRLVIAAAADYFYKSGVVGAAASVALGTVPFHRSGGLSRSSLELLKDLVSEGWSVLIFPSGTRGASSVTGFKRGFAYIAVDQQVPVVPLYLHGLDQVMPKGSRVPLPGGVAVGVGTPLQPGQDYDDLVKRSESAMLEVQAMVRRWEAA